MIFNSLAFFIFFPVVTILYFILPNRLRWLLLLLASCIFYMAFIPVYILILLFTIIVDYIAGIYIEKSVGRKRKILLIISIITNVGFLAFFKYFNFSVDNLNVLAHLLHWNYSISLLKIILPIGLSFHTFQAMSYTIEVYRGHQKAERHFGIYALYVMFYPQLVAGPIERPQNLLHQFREVHTVDWCRIASGLRLMLWGLFKKIVIADNIATIVNRVYDYPTQFNGLALIVATFLFAFQIYCDFSGYSDIAIGSAKTMGFVLMKNFDRPYFSMSIAEFWRRWHISLSSWFRDYIYIPLGGNRVGVWRWSRNVLVIFLISGLWHGAAWNYIVWGGILGFYLVVSRLTAPIRERLTRIFNLAAVPRLYGILRILITFCLVCLSWIVFRANSIGEAWYIVKHSFTGLALSEFSVDYLSRLSALLGISNFNFLHILIAIIFMNAVEFFERNRTVGDVLIIKQPWVRWSACIVLMLWIVFFGYFGERPFIYFQF